MIKKIVCGILRVDRHSPTGGTDSPDSAPYIVVLVAFSSYVIENDDDSTTHRTGEQKMEITTKTPAWQRAREKRMRVIAGLTSGDAKTTAELLDETRRIEMGRDSDPNHLIIDIPEMGIGASFAAYCSANGMTAAKGKIWLAVIISEYLRKKAVVQLTRK